jgi:hypothetical protein
MPAFPSIDLKLVEMVLWWGHGLLEGHCCIEILARVQVIVVPSSNLLFDLYHGFIISKNVSVENIYFQQQEAHICVLFPWLGLGMVAFRAALC